MISKNLAKKVLSFLSRHKLLSGFIILVLISAALSTTFILIKSENIYKKLNTKKEYSPSNPIYEEVAKKVLPEEGVITKLKTDEIITKLVSFGIIDKDKFKEIESIINQQNQEPLVIKTDNTNLWLKIFWALGLSNKTEFNKESPLNGENLYKFASTGGWTLGKEKNGGAYFNRFEIIKLSKPQEELVLSIAKSVFRPCCDNSTFFQDCNHGSAMLGMLELGASQGLSSDELYQLALVFNSFWFPDQYIETALYFKVKENQDWQSIDPKIVLDKKYSSASGWNKNIAFEVSKIPNLLPQRRNTQKCQV